MQLKKVETRQIHFDQPEAEGSDEDFVPKLRTRSFYRKMSTIDEIVITVINPTEGSTTSLNQEPTGKCSNFFTNLKSYVAELSETIEVHGIRYLFEEGRSMIEKIIWFIIVLVSLAICIYLLIDIHNTYVTAPFIVSFTTKDMPIYEIPFPAVTICSQVRSKKSGLSFAELQHIYNQNHSFSDSKQFERYQYFSLVCDHSVRKELLFVNETVDEFLDDTFMNNLKKFSPDIDDVFLECSFLNTKQNCSDLFKPIYTDRGFCFTFNMVEWRNIFKKSTVYYPGFFEATRNTCDWSPQSYYGTTDILTYPRRALVSGSTNAIKVVLRQDKNDLDSLCTSGSSGFRINIHDTLQLPDFEKHNLLVGPNAAVTASITPSILEVSHIIKSHSLEQRNCYFLEERQLKFFKNYNQANCFMECLADYTLNICECVPFYMPRNSSTRMCGASKQQCIYKAKTSFELERLKVEAMKHHKAKHIRFCDCRPFCNELNYDVVVGTSFWNWHDSVYNYSTSAENSNDTSNVVFSIFNAFFKNDEFMTLQKSENYGFATLMANIGGLLNFFIGSSLLTMVEIVYSFTFKLIFNKIIYGVWAGPADVSYNFVIK